MTDTLYFIKLCKYLANIAKQVNTRGVGVAKREKQEEGVDVVAGEGTGHQKGEGRGRKGG
jgi:hypothetical protein